MKKYEALQQFRYNSLKEAEEELSPEHPHFFLRTDPDKLQKAVDHLRERGGIVPPQALLDFWENVGPGQFFCEPPDEYAGRYKMMFPDEILGVYVPEADIVPCYNTLRADARDFLSKDGIFAFCEMDEYSALYMALSPDQDGNYPIYEYPERKIADSLEAFVTRLLEEPDYFLEDDED